MWLRYGYGGGVPCAVNVAAAAAVKFGVADGAGVRVWVGGLGVLVGPVTTMETPRLDPNRFPA